MTTLSVLDLSPSSEGVTQAQAVRNTLEVAKAADRLGYHRFWVAEHHNIDGPSSPAPEVLISALTQITSKIRLGSGGVMLVNYSPLKVAEVFMELEALAPGRIDLGVGRALGTDGRTGGALKSVSSEAFPQYFALLSAWLLDAAGKEPIDAAHPLHDIHANPSGPSHPDLFVLCTSEESATLAGQAGVGMAFAEFIARSDAGPAIAAYRAAFRASPFRETPWAGLATSALAAETPEEAWRLDAPRRAGQVARTLGLRMRFPDPESANAYLADYVGNSALAGVEARTITGDGAGVRAKLDAKARTEGADEVFVMAGGSTLETRIRSLELIAGA